MLRRIAPALLVAIAIVFGGGGRARAVSNDATPGLPTVRTAYETLLALSYRHPTPAALLSAGWSAIGDVLPRGVHPPPLPPLPADADSAFTTFAATYTAFVQRTGIANSPGRAEALALTIADGMASSLNEKHTTVVPGFDLAGPGSGQDWGLGLDTTATPPLIVTQVAADGGAQAAGVQPGDIVLAVDGKPATYPIDAMLLADAGQSSAGSAAVKLTLQRGAQQIQLPVMPGGYSFPLLSSKLLPGNIGYLKLNEFTGKTDYQQNGLQITTDLDRRLTSFETAGASGIVLDLRDNGGGSIDTAAAILGRFLPEGTLTSLNSDGAGRQISEMVNGVMRRVQLPLVVLVNRDSASSSELVAQVLRENHRALIVGTTTAGALAEAKMVELDDYALMEVGMAAVTTAAGNYTVDGAGVQPDIEIADDRTADDYRAGRDPQLDAAVAALPQAPAPPAYQPPAAPFASPQTVHNLLAGYLATVGALTGADGAAIALGDLGDYDTSNPTEIAFFGAPDPRALLQTLRTRGWLGRHMQDYTVDGQALRGLIDVAIDVYATADGAAAALETNDEPALQQPTTPPAQLGDEAVAYTGVWEFDGSSILAWRRGNAVVTVTLDQNPGDPPRPDLLLAAARQIDAAFQRYPVDGAAFQHGVATLVAQVDASAPAAAASATAAADAAPASATHADQAGSAQADAGQATASGARLPNPTLLILAAFVVTLALTGRYAFRRR